MIRCLTFFACISLLINTARSQTATLYLAKAQAAVDSGNFLHGMSIAERTAFFTSGDTAFSALSLAADAAYSAGEYQRSLEFHRASLPLCSNDSLSADVRLKMVLIFLRERDFDEARFHLMNISGELPPELSYKRDYLTGVSAFVLYEDSLAHASFYRCAFSKWAADTAFVDSVFTVASRYRPHARVRAARVASALLPGSGQLMAGNPDAAAVSLLLNTSLLLLTAHTASVYTVFDAAISIFPWFFRYYSGGVVRAGQLMTKRNLEKRNQLLNAITARIPYE